MLTAETLFANTGFSSPTPMQNEYWSKAEDFSILLSMTGSGKTLAFLLHLEQKITTTPFHQVLILCPTRELAFQVAKNYTALRSGRKTVLCYGGHSFKNEELQLREGPEVVIGTPGRILDHYKRQTSGLAPFDHLILDEYDKILELGFSKEINEIIEFSSQLKSIQLISATEIEELPSNFKNYPFSTFSFLNSEQPVINYYSIESVGHDKLHALVAFLSSKAFGPTLVFCSHRETADRISNHLNEYGKQNVVFHGGMEQIDRERSLIKFKNNSIDCLVCTDLAARGLDIPDIDAVIHYQFPPTEAEFIHRNGRTARMKTNGNVYLLHSENEPLPPYTKNFEVKKLEISAEIKEFTKSNWTTYYLSAGRKQKIRKIDIVGFLLQEVKIPKEHLGLIEVMDSYTYVAISTEEKNTLITLFPRVRIKKQPVLLSYCR